MGRAEVSKTSFSLAPSFQDSDEAVNRTGANRTPNKLGPFEDDFYDPSKFDEDAMREWLHSSCLLLSTDAIEALIDHDVLGYRVFDITDDELRHELSRECVEFKEFGGV